MIQLKCFRSSVPTLFCDHNAFDDISWEISDRASLPYIIIYLLTVRFNVCLGLLHDQSQLHLLLAHERDRVLHADHTAQRRVAGVEHAVDAVT